MTVDNLKARVASMISSDRSLLKKGLLYSLAGFPIVDYEVNRLAPVVGSLWDKVALLTLAIIAMHQYRTRTRRVASVEWFKFARYFLAYGCALVLSNFFQPFLSIAGYRIDVYFIVFGLLLPLIVTPDAVVPLLRVISAVAVVVGLHGVYQYVVKTPVPPGWIAPGEHLRTRVFSVLLSCNELGSYMALMLPIIVALVIYDARGRGKWWLGLGAIPCVLTFLFTFSRAAWLSSFIAVIIVATLFTRRLLIIPAIALGAGAWVPAVRQRIEALISPAYWLSSTHGGRIARWEQAYQAFQQNPLFGVGPGQYGGAMAAFHHFSMYADNYYAKTLGETGMVGLVLFFSMHLALIRDVWLRAKRAVDRNKILYLGGLTGLLSVFIHNNFENVFEYSSMSMSYFFVASLFLVFSGAETTVRNHPRSTSAVHPPWALFLIWAMSVYWMRTWFDSLVAHTALFGVLMLVFMITLWIISIPPVHRKTWIEFTIFILLVSQSASSHRFGHWQDMALQIIALVGLLCLAWLVTRIALSLLSVSGLIAVADTVMHLHSNPWVAHTFLQGTPLILLGAWILGGLAVRHHHKQVSLRVE